MQAFAISLSDAAGGDWKNIAVVPTLAELPEAVQRAMQALINANGEEIHFPLFIDVHPASQFEHVAWMHREKAPHTTSPSNVELKGIS